MTDLRSALRAAAPEPARPVDVAAIYARARTRRVRIAVWIAGGVLAVVAGVPGAASVLVTTDDGPGRGPTQAIGTDVDARAPESTADAPDPAETPGDPTVEEASGGGPIGGSPSTTASHDAPGVSPSTTALDSSSETYPRRAWCIIDTAGLAVDETRACRFTATDEGGANMHSDAPVWSKQSPSAYGDVVIIRGGRRQVAWQSDGDGVEVKAGDGGVFAGGCGERFIQPGDLVEMRLTRMVDEPFTVTFGAGLDQSC